MNCEKCGRPVTSQITGNLCTKCFFEAKNATIKVVEEIKPTITEAEDKPIFVAKSKEKDYLCEECNERHPIPEGNKERKCLTEHKPSKSKEIPQNGIKYCQSCIERGYGLNPASREWRPGYFICEDCYQPLLQNVINVPEAVVADKVKDIKTQLKAEPGPILSKVYDILNIPEHLRYNSSEATLKHRSDIFTHHANALVNKKLEEIASEVEEFSIILFQIKVALEPMTDYINRVKHSEREKAQLLGLEKSEKEYTKSPSKVKQSKDEKMAKTYGLSLEKYLEMVKATKQAKFDKIVGS